MAQNFSLQNFGVAEGLPSAEVYDVFQDSKGFLWFSTDNGVVKYDGFNFKTYGIVDGLPDPVVFETLEDHAGKIWFRTFSGKVAYIENEKVYPYKFNAQLAMMVDNSFLLSMVPDSLGQIWFATWGKHWGRITKNGKVVSKEIPLGVVVYKSVEHGQYIAGQIRDGQTGINSLRINDSTFQIELSDPVSDAKKSHATIRSFFWRGDQYISINNNIFRYNGTTVTRVYRADAAIISLSKDHDDNLWVGFLNGGAIRFNETNFSNPWPLTFVGLNSVTKVLEDHEQGLWIATLENGVYYIPNPDIQHYSLETKSKVDVAISTGTDLVTGEYDGTVTRINAKTKKLSKIKFNRSILTIMKARKHLWVGSERIYFLDDNNRPTASPYPPTLRDLSEDKYGNIWAVEGNGLSKYDQDGKVFFRTSTKTSYRNIFAIDSMIIIGLHTGLNILDHTLKLVKSPKQLESFKISKVLLLKDSVFLVATMGNGFLITKNFDQFSHYQSPVRNIYDVAQSDSDIWFATEKGILKSTLQSLLTRQPHYDFITRRNGLQNMQVSHLNVVGSELFAFYSNSFSVLPTGKKNYINQNPTFYLKSLKINNQARDNASLLELAHDQNNIQIDFGFISFNNQDIFTRYRLGVDQPWNDISERTIDLFSLSPGKYALELQYSVDHIHWITAPQIPTVVISPAWWDTIEFQVASIIIIAALIYLFFNNRLVIYRERSENMRLLSIQQQQLIQTEIETLERERNRIAIDLHDSVGTNILATKLNVNRLLKKHQEPESESIETQFQDTMVEIKEIIYNLSPPGLERYGLATGLKNYIERISKSTTVSFSVNTFGKELLDTNLSVPLFRILQELITNSLKHSHTKSISIHLNSFDDLYNVVYEDRGIGFSIEGKSKGLGLQNIESRIKSINGKMSFESGPFGISYTIDVPIHKTLNT